MTTKPHWKQQVFWISIFCTFLATLSLAGFIGSRWQKEEGPGQTIHVVIHHESTPVIVSPSPWVAEKGKPDVVIDNLADGEIHIVPEWREQREAVMEVFKGERSQAVLDGPPGLNAPWKK